METELEGYWNSRLQQTEEEERREGGREEGGVSKERGRGGREGARRGRGEEERVLKRKAITCFMTVIS